MLDAASTVLGRELTKLIEEKQASLLPVLLRGHAADYADYKDRAAYLRGLNDVLSWINEITFKDEAHGPFGPNAADPYRAAQGRHLA